MTKKLARYIGPRRRRWAFGQQELAYLIGLQSGSNISRLESGDREPTIRTAFAYQALFGGGASELFPGLYTEVEEALIRRAYKLHDKLKEDNSKSGHVKRQLLADALTRARGRLDKEEA